MITKSHDLSLLTRMVEPYPDIAPVEDFLTWFKKPSNIMLTEGDNIGLCTWEYPGMYSVHWYYTVRGREAINLAKRMVRELFDNYGAEVLRGFIKTRLKASRWACRQVGFKSYGLLVFPGDDENEVFCLTKEEFMRKEGLDG